ncbi:tetratricopeptide repeat protein [Roseomonas terrae]|jgi:protein O-GlcNAc transferase|uniref:protein O-GlcNAc transferase n=1 Tax=Neoroseomonas terrae TaxID=424799 RepID=A0ABS5EN29_9PROT|nr:glycosyltransferase family 41 protein [Neoroseomonas terrae]MBR0652426.1 tetratricopeptide repeat protein [Neoroseomonas terrae]
MAAADLNHCIALHQAGRLDDAIACYRRALPRDRGGVQVNRLLGIALAAAGDAASALPHLHTALVGAPRDPALLNDVGNVQRALGRQPEAVDSFRRAIQAGPAFAFAHFNLADALLEMGRHAEALEVFRTILLRRFDGMDADFHNNLGICLMALGRAEEALTAFHAALKADPAHAAAAAHAGAALQQVGRHRDSVEFLRGRAGRHGVTIQILTTLGQGLLNLNDNAPALEVFDEVLRREPELERGLTGQALALSSLGRDAAAIEAIDRAAALYPASRSVQLISGNIRLGAKDPEGAVAAFARAAALPAGRSPDAALPMLLFNRLRLCDWTDFATTRDAVLAGAAEGSLRLPPFEALCIADDPALHLRCAGLHARENQPTRRAALPAPPDGGRIRIGYVSGELREHAVGHLMARLLELHDRDAFEVHAISLGRLTGDSVEARLRAAVENFHDCSSMPDAAAIAHVRGLGLDIAVNLNGYTGNSRTALFSHGIAPVQAVFLGYPGTMGAPFMDYVIADAATVPEGADRFYAEKVVRLPGCFMPTDDQREVTIAGLTRTQFGLPEDGIVFCCFNNTHKILPEAFDGLMRILAATPGSVLWLREESAAATRNLKQAAADRAIDPARLIMAGRVDHADHLGRHALADLFLDTLPYNAHTTACDALGAGLPVLTRAGEAFAGRVAASLLRAVGLPELIADSAAAFEARAIALAADRPALTAIRARLDAALPSCTLFDTPRYTRNLEAAFRVMRDRHRAGAPPEAFAVPV